MIFGFPIRLADAELFCLHCSEVRYFHRHSGHLDLYGRESRPLLLRCRVCGSPQTTFSGDFAEFRAPNRQLENCVKVPHHSRLNVGDKVYLPDKGLIGEAKDRFRAAGREQFGIQVGEETVTLSLPDTAGQEAFPEAQFRLAPERIDHLRIGDRVYHTQRQQTGTVVGRHMDTCLRIILRLENGTLLRLSDVSRVPDPKEGESSMVKSIRRWGKSLRVEVQQITRDGNLLRLETNAEMLGPLQILAQRIRRQWLEPFVECNWKKPSQPGPETSMAWRKLQDLGESFLVSPMLELTRDTLVVKGFVEKEDGLVRLEESLAQVPGLKEIQWELEPFPSPTLDDLQLQHRLLHSIETNGMLSRQAISCRVLDGHIYLDGFVRSGIQRNAAALIAAWAGRNLHIQNNLRMLEE